MQKRLLAEIQLLKELVVLGKIVLLEVVEQLATAAGHLKEAAAAVEVFAVRAQMLGQVIDASGEQCDLDFGRAGILFVDFIFCDDFGFNDGRHGLVMMLHNCRGPLQAPCHPLQPRGKPRSRPASPFQSGGMPDQSW